MVKPCSEFWDGIFRLNFYFMENHGVKFGVRYIILVT
jgi:hypothetical protein